MLNESLDKKRMPTRSTMLPNRKRGWLLPKFTKRWDVKEMCVNMHIYNITGTEEGEEVE